MGELSTHKRSRTASLSTHKHSQNRHVLRISTHGIISKPACIKALALPPVVLLSCSYISCSGGLEKVDKHQSPTLRAGEGWAPDHGPMSRRLSPTSSSARPRLWFGFAAGREQALAGASDAATVA